MINMTHWCEFFAYDVMSDLAFSEDFGMLQNGKPHRYVSALHGATRILTIAAQTPWARPVMSLFPVDRQSKIDGKEFARISMDTYARRKARTPKQNDIFGHLAAQKAEVGRRLTESELIADTSRKSTACQSFCEISANSDCGQCSLRPEQSPRRCASHSSFAICATTQQKWRACRGKLTVAGTGYHLSRPICSVWASCSHPLCAVFTYLFSLT
jgi:hypothetical protein